jgi:hypothetical protein
MEEILKRKSYLRCKRIQSNLSSGRKVFRLLKFSDELSSIIRHSRSDKKKTLFREILFYSSGVCSFFYYLLDNIIWLSYKKYPMLGKVKDLFSMGRCLIEIWKSLLEIATDLKKEERILKELGLYDNCFIVETDESYSLIRDLIKLRRQMSFYVLELITNVLRVFMLYKSLKFMGSIYLDSIFVELCGVMSSFFALMKSIKKKSFEKVQQRERERQQEKMEKKKVSFHEEEKRSKELFMDDIMSVDDSDIMEENRKFANGSVHPRVAKLKSTMSSTHDNMSQKSAKMSKLKQVRSSINVYKTGSIKMLRKGQNEDEEE